MPKKTGVPFTEEISMLLGEIQEKDFIDPSTSRDPDAEFEKLITTGDEKPWIPDNHAKKLWALGERFEKEVLGKIEEGGIFSNDVSDDAALALIMRKTEVCRNLFWIHLWETLPTTPKSSEIGIRSGWEVVECKHKETERPQPSDGIRIILGIPSFKSD